MNRELQAELLMEQTIIGVMGPGEGATESDIKTAHELGRLIARQGWVLLTGGRNVGVMDAASRGASEAGGLTIGILPTEDTTGCSPYVDIPITTGMGSARNNINVLTSHLIIACGSGRGTVSEIMLSLKAGKHVIVLNQSHFACKFLEKMAGQSIVIAESPSEALRQAKTLL